MKVQDDPPLHLTYCLNVHPGETWAENLAAIREHALAVRERVAPGRRFGLGLRLGAAAAATLARPPELAAFERFLAENDLYVFTINGFPYGAFHGRPVKADVYRPDWTTPQRRDYTIALANLLAHLMPEDVSGSISTVPGSYAEWVRTEADVEQMARMLAETAMHLSAIRRCTGKLIRLALEPEPDCWLQTTGDVLSLLAGPLVARGSEHLRKTFGLGTATAHELLREHLGVCFDAAHLAVQFEDLAESLLRLSRENVPVAKVQLSSALRVEGSPEALQRLEAFCDPVYLHQVKVRRADGSIVSYPDLPAALKAARESPPFGEMRVHFHVPLFFAGAGPLRSTGDALCGPFAELLRQGITEHLEIETYTFGVLPEPLRPPSATEGIVREYEWVLENVLR